MALACKADDQAAIGRFEVNASLVESCGETGLLAAPPVQQYSVHLRRVGTSIHWEGRSDLQILVLAGDGRTFRHHGSMTVDMRQGSAVADTAPCIIERVDLTECIFDAAPDLAAGFSGSERHDFAPLDGSECTDLLAGPEAIAEALPCAIEYELEATRIE
jgi:hypothetical protein